MSAQGLIVAVLVLACALQATWKLMPAAWRRGLSARLLGRETVSAAGCGGCDGCGGSVKTARAAAAATSVGSAKPLVFHPRRRH